MGFVELAELCMKLGLPTVLVLFFVWDGRSREAKRNERISALEQFQTEVLLGLVKDSTKHQERSNQIMTESIHIMSESTRTIEVALRILEKRSDENSTG